MSTVGENINEVERIAAEKAEKSRRDNEARAAAQKAEEEAKAAEEAAKGNPDANFSDAPNDQDQ